MTLAGLLLTAAGFASAQSGSGSFSAPIYYSGIQVGNVTGSYTYNTMQCGPTATFVVTTYTPAAWQFGQPASPPASANAHTYDPNGAGGYSDSSSMTFFSQSTGAGCPQPGYQGGPNAYHFGTNSGYLGCYNGSAVAPNTPTRNPSPTTAMNGGYITSSNAQSALSPSFTLTSLPNCTLY